MTVLVHICTFPQRKVSYFTSCGHTIPYLLEVKFVTFLLSVTILIVKQ